MKPLPFSRSQGNVFQPGRGGTGDPNPSLVAWLPFNTTGPIITPSPWQITLTALAAGNWLILFILIKHTYRLCCWICLDTVTRSKGTVRWSLGHSSKICKKIIWQTEGAVKRLSGSIYLSVSSCLLVPWRLCEQLT